MTNPASATHPNPNLTLTLTPSHTSIPTTVQPPRSEGMNAVLKGLVTGPDAAIVYVRSSLLSSLVSSIVYTPHYCSRPGCPC